MLESEDDEIVERSGPGRRASDKPSAWTNPALWVSICSILLTITICLFGYISGQLSTLLVASTRNDMRIQAVEKRSDELEAWRKQIEKDRRDDDKRFNDYQYGNGKLLGEIKGQLEGLKKEK